MSSAITRGYLGCPEDHKPAKRAMSYTGELDVTTVSGVVQRARGSKSKLQPSTAIAARLISGQYCILLHFNISKYTTRQ